MEPGSLREAVRDPWGPVWRSPTSIGEFLPELCQFDASFDGEGEGGWRTGLDGASETGCVSVEPGSLREAVRDPWGPVWQSPTSIGEFLPKLCQFDASFDGEGEGGWRTG